jgi:hypothetical protein
MAVPAMLAIFTGSHHRQMVDDTETTSMKSIHRVVAVVL